MNQNLPRLAGCAVAVFALAGCATGIKAPFLLYDDPGISGVNPPPMKPTGVDPYPEFNRALAKAQAETSAKEDQVALLRSGMSLVRFNCLRYFDRLALVDQNSRFARKETTLTGGLLASTLGLAGATSKTLANTATLFAFGVASLDNYSETYVFSPEVKVVEQLVMTALDVYVKEATGFVGAAGDGSAPLQAGAVLTYLARMEASCQPHGIRDLVNKALNQAKAEVKDGADDKDKAKDKDKDKEKANGAASKAIPSPSLRDFSIQVVPR